MPEHCRGSSPEICGIGARGDYSIVVSRHALMFCPMHAYMNI